MTGSDQALPPLRPSRPRGADLAEIVPGAPSVRVTGVSMSSRSVCPGDLYVGLPGATTHGARYVQDAVERGAVAVVTDEVGAALAGDPGVPVVVVEEPRRRIGEWAAEVYGRPAERLQAYGITGTNGKTTTMYLLAAALTAAGRTVATIGTIGARVAGETLAMSRTTVTTPESPDLQALLALVVERGADTVVMEVSSHALAMHRVDAVRFAVAGFTNLGWDHRDFHPTQEDYFEAKARLFLPGQSDAAVVATDDAWGRRLADRVREAGLPLLTTGEQGDVRAAAVSKLGGGSQRVEVDLGERRLEVVLGLPGAHNVRNLLTAVGMLEQGGVPLDAAVPGFADVTIPGRLERVDLGEGAPDVYVDFAHTPEAVAAALAALNDRRTVCVLGCGGDRDHLKRGPMGEVAVTGSDVLVVTDDNPRTEDPLAIRQAILEGAAQAKRVADPTSRAARCEVFDGGDRRSAINLALRSAREGDVVAVLGKGHEHGQEMRGTVTAFNDADVVREEWAGLRRVRPHDEGAPTWS
ncbi:MAG TPA: UDP-N-acetylmuramoyl-L-alanyl-D-glutamate--2,6-diaminopimelate ligase [Propionibacteriaceae bacterium]|nr:UDP-N-acetylmuramoyl-L-alanyl-D-glutamate--2,6-diaminopimelate ligase [Propionibacteriaceae bacterium]